MKYGDKGKHVRHLQLTLIKAGYELPKFGADSHFGDETWEALQDFALDHEFVWAPELKDSAVAAMMNQMDESPASVDDVATVPSFDLRQEPVPSSVYRKFKMRSGKVVKRAPIVVDGITIHQTGVLYSVNDRQIAAANGDERLALANRAKKIAAHAVSFDGFFTKTYPLEWYIYHGNGLNRKTLGLEIDGLYPGLLDKPETVELEHLTSIWKGTATDLIDRRVKSARAALRYLVDEGRKLGMPIKYIYAHRQSSATRRSDPGEELWRKVVEEYAVPELGLETRPTFTTGSGRVIPDDWAPNGDGPY
jgi:hypothetical protein